MRGFNRWAVCAAWYWYAITHHSGQFSPEYRILGRLERIGYKPTHDVEYGKLNHHEALIYADLVRAGKPSGYSDCACSECFEITLDVFCSDCEAAECGLAQRCNHEPTDPVGDA